MAAGVVTVALLVIWVGLPLLLAPTGRASVDRLDAMAEWTRSLAGVLTVGVGLEQALIALARSAPAAIRPEVEHSHLGAARGQQLLLSGGRQPGEFARQPLPHRRRPRRPPSPRRSNQS